MEDNECGEMYALLHFFHASFSGPKGKNSERERVRAKFAKSAEQSWFKTQEKVANSPGLKPRKKERQESIVFWTGRVPPLQKKFPGFQL